MESMQSVSSSYIHLTEGKKPVNDGQNRVYFCELNQYYSADVFRNFSIKFTLEGMVQYKTEKAIYRLTPSQFLLSSKQPCECTVKSSSLTRNISIDISEETINEVFTTLSGLPNDMDNLQAKHFISPDFFENQYPVHSSPLGVELALLAKQFSFGNNPVETLTDESFFSLAEKVIQHEMLVQHSMDNLSAIKSSTRKETLRRLLNGKYFMDENFLTNPGIAEVAREANLSEYYFLRNFKNAFAISPHQYVLDKKLRHAQSLLKKSIPAQEVAMECCFPDIASFSKAFRKKFGYPPSKENSI